MSLQRRTEKTPLIIEDFEGCNQLIDDLTLKSESPPWMHGCFPNVKMNVERIPGKLLASTATTGGHVLTLHQLEFTDRSVMLIHQSSNYSIETDLTNLMTEPDVTPLAPLEPFIFR
jgi:hypothetical protein